MTPTDPRHGTSAGYVAGCRNTCCQQARRRQQKRRRALNHTGISAWATSAQAAAAIQPWRQMGYRDAAIIRAAGLTNEHIFQHERILATTLQALLRVTEDRFDANATVPAALTRFRIHSLMAAGHRLADMPVGDRGQWRYRDRVRVYIARDIRDYYAANEARLGPSAHTQARARNAGHIPPMAWDDPGTLAWPTGEPELVTTHPTGRPEKIRAHIENLEWLADTDESLTSAAARLGLRRETIRDYCTETGRSDLYWRLAGRENNADHRKATRDGMGAA